MPNTLERIQCIEIDRTSTSSHRERLYAMLIGPPPVTTSASLKRSIERGVALIAFAPATSMNGTWYDSTKDAGNLPTARLRPAGKTTSNLTSYSGIGGVTRILGFHLHFFYVRLSELCMFGYGEPCWALGQFICPIRDAAGWPHLGRHVGGYLCAGPDK